MLNKGVLSQPIPSHDKDFPIIQYAGDTLLIAPAVDSQFIALKEMFHTFHTSTGLKVNFHKLSMVPICEACGSC